MTLFTRSVLFEQTTPVAPSARDGSRASGSSLWGSTGRSSVVDARAEKQVFKAEASESEIMAPLASDNGHCMCIHKPPLAAAHLNFQVAVPISDTIASVSGVESQQFLESEEGCHVPCYLSR